eukprot:14670002-Alexandrium_andersonii.AAC.1
MRPQERPPELRRALLTFPGLTEVPWSSRGPRRDRCPLLSRAVQHFYFRLSSATPRNRHVATEALRGYPRLSGALGGSQRLAE